MVNGLCTATVLLHSSILLLPARLLWSPAVTPACEHRDGLCVSRLPRAAPHCRLSCSLPGRKARLYARLADVFPPVFGEGEIRSVPCVLFSELTLRLSNAGWTLSLLARTVEANMFICCVYVTTDLTKYLKTVSVLCVRVGERKGNREAGKHF